MCPKFTSLIHFPWHQPNIHTHHSICYFWLPSRITLLGIDFSLGLNSLYKAHALVCLCLSLDFIRGLLSHHNSSVALLQSSWPMRCECNGKEWEFYPSHYKRNIPSIQKIAHNESLYIISLNNSLIKSQYFAISALDLSLVWNKVSIEQIWFSSSCHPLWTQSTPAHDIYEDRQYSTFGGYHFFVWLCTFTVF